MAAAFALTTVGASQAEESVAKRQAKQKERIAKGAKRGQLTKREANRLKRQQTRIQQAKKKAQADGKLTPAEKARLARKQDKAGGNISSARHNDQIRGN
jgi:hypothetical protein